MSQCVRQVGLSFQLSYHTVAVRDLDIHVKALITIIYCKTSLGLLLLEYTCLIWPVTGNQWCIN